MFSTNSSTRLAPATRPRKKCKQETPAPFEIYEDDTATLARPVHTLAENIRLFRTAFHGFIKNCEGVYAQKVNHWLRTQVNQWYEHILQEAIIADLDLGPLVEWETGLQEKIDTLSTIRDLQGLVALIGEVKEELRTLRELSDGRFDISLQADGIGRSWIDAAIIGGYYYEAGYGLDLQEDANYYSSRMILWQTIIRDHLGADFLEAGNSVQRNRLMWGVFDSIETIAERNWEVDVGILKESGWLDQCQWINRGRRPLSVRKNL